MEELNSVVVVAPHFQAVLRSQAEVDFPGVDRFQEDFLVVVHFRGEVHFREAVHLLAHFMALVAAQQQRQQEVKL